MSWKFNPPPGWPEQPEGWVPPPGWTPDPSWPPAPPGWQFWVPASGQPASAPGAPAAPPGEPAAGAQAAPGVAQPGVAQPGVAQPGVAQPAAGGHYPATPAGMGMPAGASAAPAGATAHLGSSTGDRPWFTRWWTMVLLVGLLALGLIAGFGSTRVALELAAEEAPAPGPTATPTPVEPTDAPEPEPTLGGQFLPTDPPDVPDGELTSVCGEVAVIMLQVIRAGMDEPDDLDEYLDGVIEARRNAADELREVETDDSAERDGLDTFADELDEAADQADNNRRDIDIIEDSFDRVGDAYFDFNADHC